MAYKKGDRVLLIEGDKESGYRVSRQKVESGANNKVILVGMDDEFTHRGPHRTKPNKAIAVWPECADQKKSQSVFVRGATSVDIVTLSDKTVEKILQSMENT